MSDDEDTLFDRAVCHDATDADWQALDALAARDPELWHRLALALRDQGDLVQDMRTLSAVAATVELVPRRRATWAGRAGWSLAAAALLWIGASWLLTPPLVWRAPAETGIELLGDLPSIFVSAKPLPGGQGVEVTYVRRLVERRTTATLLEQAEDEWGQPTMVPADLHLTTTQEL